MQVCVATDSAVHCCAGVGESNMTSGTVLAQKADRASARVASRAFDQAKLWPELQKLRLFNFGTSLAEAARHDSGHALVPHSQEQAFRNETLQKQTRPTEIPQQNIPCAINHPSTPLEHAPSCHTTAAGIQRRWILLCVCGEWPDMWELFNISVQLRGGL